MAQVSLSYEARMALRQCSSGFMVPHVSVAHTSTSKQAIRQLVDAGYAIMIGDTMAKLTQLGVEQRELLLQD